MARSVLIVDDEVDVLNAIELQLAPEGYILHRAISGAAGLEVLKKNSVSVIISDLCMPGMDGVSFLQAAATICPHSVRMVLSGYAEIHSVLDSVNEGHIWRFISKPWVPEELAMSIRNALDLWESEAGRRLLISELEEKNSSLERLNALLENAVYDRTWELTERSQILHLILEETPLAIVLERCLASVRKIVGHADIYILPSFKNRPSPPAALAIVELLKTESLKRRKPVVRQGWLALPLAKGGDYLGAMILRQGGRDMNEMISSLDSLATLIAMALHQDRIMASVPDLLGNIEVLLEEIS